MTLEEMLQKKLQEAQDKGIIKVDNDVKIETVKTESLKNNSGSGK